MCLDEIFTMKLYRNCEYTKKLMIAIIIRVMRSIFSLLTVIMISKIFHFGKNPKSGGIPPSLNSRIDKLIMFDLFM